MGHAAHPHHLAATLAVGKLSSAFDTVHADTLERAVAIERIAAPQERSKGLARPLFKH